MYGNGLQIKPILYCRFWILIFIKNNSIGIKKSKENISRVCDDKYCSPLFQTRVRKIARTTVSPVRTKHLKESNS
jgi:hypothetical protein